MEKLSTPTDIPPEILHVPEVAEMLNISKDALWHAIRNNTAPPSTKLMGRRVFRKHEVINWINQQFDSYHGTGKNIIGYADPTGEKAVHNVETYN